jgi:hypothetical protein
MREIAENELDLISGAGGEGPSFLADGNVSSQAEKRLETQRKDLTRNWAG